MSGLIHRVWVDLRCERCGKIHETDIRIRCFDEIGDYRLGERVPVGERLIVGENYEGNADRYCEKCFRKWTEALSILSYECLAELLEQGRVSARDAVSGVSLSRQHVLEKGCSYTESEVSQVPYLAVTGPFFTELELIFDGELVVVGGTQWGEFLEVIDPMLNRKLQDSGWRPQGYLHEDFNIYLDADRRILVEETEGNRL
jgi:hypothetical protein